jgi:hypothetical protein
MSAYTPHDPLVIVVIAAIFAGELLFGFGITRLTSVRLARLLAWLVVLVGGLGVERLAAGEPAGIRMLAIIGALLFAMKTVVTVEAQADGMPRLRAWQWLAFAVAWPGMRPVIFAKAGSPPLTGAGRLIGFGAVRLLAGLLFTFVAWWIWYRGRPPLSDLAACAIATLLLMVGLSLILHFGGFNLLAGLWRLAGVDARPLFRAPLAARSLAEFWGRRWNLAFAEMTALAVYRPLSGAGRRTALAAAFLFSGLLHEAAISVPVLAGFGLPLAYFALHGVLVLLERRLEVRGHAVAGWGWLSYVWVLCWLGLPAPILFHPPFLRGVVWPLIGMDP